MFVVELVLPFLIFFPRRLRFSAGFGILLLEGCIVLTGNYNWFNLQTMLLCLPLFDDAALRRIAPIRLLALMPAGAQSQEPRRAATIFVNAVALMMMFLSLVQMDERFGGSPPGWALAIDDLFEPFHIVSPYGLFSVMTTTRDEIIVEGSDDGVQWREYEFRYKPGDLMRRPPWNIPHQPRLDWQMWFAALDDPQRVPWFSRFLERLLENEPSVTGLLERNPFPNKPPTYVRAELYEYSYAGKDQAAGQWWNRRLAGLYSPRARLKTEGE
jgi:lipase maturation factor 1